MDDSGASGSVPRDENGRLEKGAILNPTGANGHNAGWQRYGDRLQKYLNMPLGELRALVANTEELDKLSQIDAVCVMQAFEMYYGSAARSEREDALNRIEGRPTQKLDMITAPFNVTINK